MRGQTQREEQSKHKAEAERRAMLTELATSLDRQVKAVAEAYVTASNANDKATVLAQFAPDTVWFDPVGQPPHVGVEGVGEFYDQTRALADRVEMKLLDLIVCGAEG